MRILAAAALYVALVFAAGFGFGALRVLFVEPRLGPTGAVLFEMPLILWVSYRMALWVPRRLGLGHGYLAMGAMAFGLLHATEMGLGIALRGLTPAAQIAAWATPAGALFLGATLVFALLPAWAHRSGG